ncbi:unnamed protein product [Pieris macdunnoughi]|uniref:EGF-like domain-containing protein n=1 Tax=Pieris macdunnoughi TaxID=345717 RepID=A0A821W824_9NEOP|nr:unnamed protein product [Pieris macdunnoughi]
MSSLTNIWYFQKIRIQLYPNSARNVWGQIGTTFVCSCPRPYLGHTCQYNYTAATFGQESARRHSVVVVNVSEAARRAVHAALDISMFVRTRKPTGQIFHLGSGASRYRDNVSFSKNI